MGLIFFGEEVGSDLVGEQSSLFGKLELMALACGKPLCIQGFQVLWIFYIEIVLIELVQSFQVASPACSQCREDVFVDVIFALKLLYLRGYLVCREIPEIDGVVADVVLACGTVVGMGAGTYAEIARLAPVAAIVT